jgi:hypothetical protein
LSLGGKGLGMAGFLGSSGRDATDRRGSDSSERVFAREATLAQRDRAGLHPGMLCPVGSAAPAPSAGLQRCATGLTWTHPRCNLWCNLSGPPVRCRPPRWARSSSAERPGRELGSRSAPFHDCRARPPEPVERAAGGLNQGAASVADRLRPQAQVAQRSSTSLVSTGLHQRPSESVGIGEHRLVRPT